MRVCMVVYSFFESDPRVRQYATALQQRGDTVDVIALRKADQPEFGVVEGINVFRIQTRPINEKRKLHYTSRILRFMLHSAVKLTKSHRKEPYQLIHVHSVPDFLVYSALMPKLSGAKVILDIHDLLPELYASKFQVGNDSTWFKLMSVAERKSCAFADHVIVANDLWRERLIKRSVPPEKCTTVRNYPVMDLFKSQARQRKNGKFLITYPGSLNKHQGLEVAIKAFARVSDRMPDSEFHIYGEGSYKPTLIQLTKDLNLDTRIFFHKGMPSREIAKVMVDTDLAVEPKLSKIPFSNEAASTKILEFMAAGVPIVASSTSIHRWYYDDTILKYYESDNDEALAACIFAMWQDPQGRAQQVQRANDYVAQNNWDVKKKDYLDLVDRLAARH